MRTVSLKCENCGGVLEIDEQRESCFCTYCGNKILIKKDEFVYRIVDEAKLKELENAQQKEEQNRKAEEENKKLIEKRKKEKLKAKLILLAVWVVAVVALFVLSSATADNVGFSPYQFILFPLLIVGVIVIIKEVVKFFKNA